MPPKRLKKSKQKSDFTPSPVSHQPIQTPSNIRRLGMREQAIMMTPKTQYDEKGCSACGSVGLYGIYEPVRSDYGLPQTLARRLFNEEERNDDESDDELPSSQPIQSSRSIRMIGVRRQTIEDI